MEKNLIYRISKDRDVENFLDNLDFTEHSKSICSHDSSGNMRPNDIAEKLFGFKADFTEQPPFCFIKANTRIWELFFLRKRSDRISYAKYKELTRGFKNSSYRAFDGCTSTEIGPKKQENNRVDGDWINVYPEICECKAFDDAAKKYIEYLLSGSRLDGNKLIPIRAYKNRNWKKDFSVRSKAAKAFFRYMIGDKKFNLTQDDVVQLEEMKNDDGRLEENQLIYLLDNRPNRHVFFVGLMLCLFGRSYTNESNKKRVIGVSANFARKIALLLPKFADNQEYADLIKNDILRELKSKKKNEISPIYRENIDQKYRVSFRLNTWIHLLIESKKAF
jgi:hypothetical protein